MSKGAWVVGLCLAATAARADDTGEARERFKQGAELVQKAQWAEALTAFEQSARLRPHAVTTYNIGACERALGRYTRARATLDRALADDQKARAGGTAQLPDSLMTEAHGWVDEIDRLLARVLVGLEPADAMITVDGRPLEVAKPEAHPPLLVAGTLAPGLGTPPPGGAFELLLDPGVHVFTIARKGFADVVVNRSFAPGAHDKLSLALDRLPATLHVEANRSQAVVKVNGLDVGAVPVDVKRPAGAYKVEVAWPGFQAYKAQIEVRPGEEVAIRASLERVKTPIYKRWWFWTGAGAVVVGAILGGYFGAQAAQTPRVDGGGLGWAVQLR